LFQHPNKILLPRYLKFEELLSLLIIRNRDFDGKYFDDIIYYIILLIIDRQVIVVVVGM
ncbi:hypothetical protein ACJX0J_008074, partial [Zea mays]